MESEFRIWAVYVRRLRFVEKPANRLGGSLPSRRVQEDLHERHLDEVDAIDAAAYAVGSGIDLDEPQEDHSGGSPGAGP